MATRKDLRAHQGATYTSDTYVWTKDGSTLIPLTGVTATMKIRATSLGTGTLIATLTNGSGITLGGTAGTFILSQTAAQTLAMTPGRYWYDLLFAYSTGDYAGTTDDVLEGFFTVESTPTQ